MTNTKYVVIVPHGFCSKENSVRHCDRRATEEAKKLGERLTSMGLVYDMFVADRLREKVDYNRGVARQYKLRRDIRGVIEGYVASGHKVVVFEVHSFPGVFYTHHPFKNCQVALISIGRYYEAAQRVSNHIRKGTGYVVYCEETSDTNDIQWETSLLGGEIDHYLIEFNEDKTVLTSKQSDNVHAFLI